MDINLKNVLDSNVIKVVLLALLSIFLVVIVLNLKTVLALFGVLYLVEFVRDNLLYSEDRKILMEDILGFVDYNSDGVFDSDDIITFADDNLSLNLQDDV